MAQCTPSIAAEVARQGRTEAGKTGVEDLMLIFACMTITWAYLTINSLESFPGDSGDSWFWDDSPMFRWEVLGISETRGWHECCFAHHCSRLLDQQPSATFKSKAKEGGAMVRQSRGDTAHSVEVWFQSSPSSLTLNWIRLKIPIYTKHHQATSWFHLDSDWFHLFQSSASRLPNANISTTDVSVVGGKAIDWVL